MESDDEEKGVLYQFKQQVMAAWQPVPTLNKTIALFTFLGLLFLSLGIVMQVYTQTILEYSVRYDDQCRNSNPCTVTLKVDQDMAGPVFVYYQLTNYYQNHRLYIKSQSIKQLQGNTLSVSAISTDCDPIVKNSDLYTTKALDGSTLDPDGPANPCGLIAYTVFNDSYIISNTSSLNLPISSAGIAWPSDVGRYKISNASQMWYNVTDQRFLVWIRVAGLPDFRKIWGRMDYTLTKGQYQISITNNYNVTSIGSQKYLVVSQSNAFGSKNEFLSISYLTFGSACLVISMGFLGKKIHKRLTGRESRML